MVGGDKRRLNSVSQKNLPVTVKKKKKHKKNPTLLVSSNWAPGFLFHNTVF